MELHKNAQQTPANAVFDFRRLWAAVTPTTLTYCYRRRKRRHRSCAMRQHLPKTRKMSIPAVTVCPVWNIEVTRIVANARIFPSFRLNFFRNGYLLSNAVCSTLFSSRPTIDLHCLLARPTFLDTDISSRNTLHVRFYGFRRLSRAVAPQPLTFS